MTPRVKLSREELRAQLPELAAFVDAAREAFGPGVRVLSITTPEWTMGTVDTSQGIRLSQCAWDPPPKPEAVQQQPRRRRRA